MNIDERKITVGEVAEGYENNDEEGVTGYSGRLDIRPKYQREFVYDDEKRDEVIRTIIKGLLMFADTMSTNPDGTNIGDSSIALYDNGIIT